VTAHSDPPESERRADLSSTEINMRVQRFSLETLLREVKQEEKYGTVGYTRYNQDDLNQLINKINNPEPADEAT
jgi:hypothetical protein